jgi:hypothetical protein
LTAQEYPHPLGTLRASSSRREWRCVERIGACGETVRLGVPKLPRVDDDVLNCSVYLYPTVEDAERGTQAGGCGFLIALPTASGNEREPYLYAITNNHVAKSSPVVRALGGSGKTIIVPLKADDWISHEGGDDVAAAFLTGEFRFALKDSMLLDRATYQRESIGLGLECFMIGRLKSHDGGVRNQPIARFGNISMTESKVELESGLRQDAFLVEVKSIGGHSGSPVFVYDYLGRFQESPTYLLGINCAHIQTELKVKNPDGLVIGRIKENTGQAVVIPAWKIREVLDSPVFAEGREQTDAILRQRRAEAAGQFHDDS